MKKITILTGILFFSIFTGRGQEKLFTIPGADHSIPFDAEVIGDRLFFSVMDWPNYWPGEIVNSYLFVTDLSMNTIDSIDMSAELGLSKGAITAMTSFQDTLLAIVVNEKVWQPWPTDNYLLLYNADLVLVDSVSISSPDPSNIYLQSLGVSNIEDSLIIVSYRTQNVQTDSVYYPGIRVFGSNLQLIHDESYNDIGIEHNELVYTEFVQFTKFDDHFITYQLYPFNFIALISLNLDYSYDTSYHSQNFVPPTHFRVDNFLYKDLNTLYAAGYVNTGNNLYSYGILKFDRDLQITRFDTTLSPDRVLDQNGCIDYYTLDNVIFAITEGDNLNGGPYIEVASMDTSGQVNWQRKIFQDSTAWFVVREVVATADGGAFIVSDKYDERFNPTWHHRTSIIKIDSTGGIVGQKEWPVKERIAIYPNPATGYVQLDNFPGQVAQLRIYDQQGRELRNEEVKLAEHYSVSGLQTGVYIFVVTTEEGERYSSVVKKN